ncbi:MAG TPA: 6,7-dimethyl-8-ribityllumazine synthase [Longimicrobiaceae bacterium]|nr:6,7-dimethyl-8-ribityllumazine synthase [Longimicrobiaceae bacterium]
MIEHHGQLRGEGRRFGIAIGRFNEFITRQLLAGARDCLLRHGVADEDIEVAWVPGAWEVPAALRRLARTGRFDALIALGAVVRGATPHFDYVAGEAAHGSSAVAAAADLPVSFGVLTTDTLEQAIERAGTKAGNKGWDAALAALEMVDLFARLDGEARDVGS